MNRCIKKHERMVGGLKHRHILTACCVFSPQRMEAQFSFPLENLLLGKITHFTDLSGDIILNDCILSVHSGLCLSVRIGCT